MNLLRSLFFLFGWLTMTTQPADACSVSRETIARTQMTAEQRVGSRQDLRKVRGDFKITHFEPGTYLEPGKIVGEVSTLKGRSYKTSHDYMDLWVECMIYYLPRADAKGVFYISRKSKGGLFELFDWNGEYAEQVAQKIHPYDEQETED